MKKRMIGILLICLMLCFQCVSADNADIISKTSVMTLTPGSKAVLIRYDRDDSHTGHYLEFTRNDTGKVYKKTYASTKSYPTSVKITGLLNDIEFTVKIAPYDLVGKTKVVGEFLEEQTFTPVATPALHPENVSISAGSKSATFSFSQSGIYTGVNIRVYRLTDGKLIKSLNATTKTTGKISSLVNGTPYRAEVYYYNKVGTKVYRSPECALGYFMPMTAPENVQVRPDGTRATVSMTADKTVEGIVVLYGQGSQTQTFAEGCRGSGNVCSFDLPDTASNYEFFVMKYKTFDGRVFTGPGVLANNRLSPKTVPFEIAEEDEPMIWYLLDEWN